MTKRLRGIGDWSDLGEDNSLTALLAKCDGGGTWWVYVRQSKLKLDNPGYLQYQRSVADLLVEMGIPTERIVLLDEDVNKAGWESHSVRTDLRRIMAQAGSGDVIVITQISRLYRDRRLTLAVNFANKMAGLGVKVLHEDTGKWATLDLKEPSDYDEFIRLCQNAAKSRDQDLGRMRRAKEEAVTRGAWSGAPVPIGWALTPKRKGEDQRYVVYEPHAAVKLEIMAASLLPSINSDRDLHRYCMKHGILIPPFEGIALLTTYAVSVLSDVRVPDCDGRMRPPRPDEAVVPTIKMMHNLLLDTLVIGDLRIGTGRAAKSRMERHVRARLAEGLEPILDLREGRVLAGNFPEYAILKTDEKQEFFWRIVTKWSELDLRSMREERYEIEMPNVPRAERLNTVGRPRTQGRTQCYAGIVECGSHGALKESPKMTYSKQKKGWECLYAWRQGGSICQSLGDNDRLNRVLDTFAKQRLRDVLRQENSALVNLVKERDQAKALAATLQAELRLLEESLRDKQDDWDVRRKRKKQQDVPREEIKRAYEAFYTVHIEPIEGAIEMKQRELRTAEREGLKSPPALSMDEIRNAMRGRLRTFDGLPCDEKHNLVSLLYERVRLWVCDGMKAREALLQIIHPTGDESWLVTWRGYAEDDRLWTPEEDAALSQFWPPMDWENLRMRLQPNRRMNKIRQRVYDLHLGYSRRHRAWADALRDTEKTYPERHQDVLYLELMVDGNEPSLHDNLVCNACVPTMMDGKEGTIMPIPDEVQLGLKWLVRNVPSRK